MKKGYGLELCRDGGTLWERVNILDFFWSKISTAHNAKNLAGRSSEQQLTLEKHLLFLLWYILLCQLHGRTYSEVFKNTFSFLKLHISSSFILL